ncbi:MAG: hypothetical protein HKN63_11770 [Rhodobacteraceae bacterium]|nr:hypothetical protein [Paracoccaceae bacterium]
MWSAAPARLDEAGLEEYSVFDRCAIAGNYQPVMCEGPFDVLVFWAARRMAEVGGIPEASGDNKAMIAGTPGADMRVLGFERRKGAPGSGLGRTRAGALTRVNF